MKIEGNVASQSSADKCPECSGQNLIRDDNSGEIVCGNCGFVIRRIMDRGEDWRAFTPEERKSRPRAGAPPMYSIHDKGLSTTIGRIDYDAFGRKLPLETRFQMWRLRKWQIRSRMNAGTARNLAQAMAEIGRLSDKLAIPKQIKETAAFIYRKALDERIIRGRSIPVIATAALYTACRITRVPRTLKEISEASLFSKKEIGRGYRLLIRKLNLKIPIVDPVDYISKIAGPLKISGETQGLAIKILQEAKRKRIRSGKDPKGLAAAALYIAGQINNEGIRQHNLAETAGVTEVTIRNRYKQLRRELGLKLP